MMTLDELHTLCRDDVRAAIEENLQRDSAEVALSLRSPDRALIATQIKYLQRARRKLPSYYAVRAIVPPLAFEQASSEECAAHKPLTGRSVLDLTCGLGVDAAALSHHFERVVSVERSDVLAALARENFSRMGITNVEVVCASAEEFVAQCDEHFDWCYADPDRRSEQGRKLVRIEECSPDIIALMPHLRRIAERLCVKCSPMFDVEEAYRLFEGCSVEVVSLADECKEVLIFSPADGVPTLRATALGMGTFAIAAAERHVVKCVADTPFDTVRYKYLTLPDVALQKARLVAAATEGAADVWSDNGCAFAVAKSPVMLGRTFDIEQIVPYSPKELRRRLKHRAVDIFVRDFPLSQPEILRQLGAREGVEERWCFTSAGGAKWAIKLGQRYL